jgi:hypothetical protein
VHRHGLNQWKNTDMIVACAEGASLFGSYDQAETMTKFASLGRALLVHGPWVDSTILYLRRCFRLRGATLRWNDAAHHT